MSSITRLSQSWVFPSAVVAFLIPLFILEWQVMNYTRGVLAYPLDDAFIHMGIAKNLALHGVWGISRYEFVSASSSILYPLILSATYLLIGPNMIAPLIINIIASIFLLKVIENWLIRQGLTPLYQLLILLSVMLLIPLPIIAGIGMEHVLQILFDFLFIYHFSGWLSLEKEKKQPSWKLPLHVYLYGILVTGIRYEGMFIIFIAVIILFYFGKYELSIWLGMISMLPVIIFGIISLYQGNYFFPNSLLLKSNSLPLNVTGLISFLTDGIFHNIYYSSPSNSSVVIYQLLLIVPLTYLFIIKVGKEAVSYKFILAIIAGTIFLHLILAKTTWFYRYEAYIIGTSMVIVMYIFIKYGAPMLVHTSRASRVMMLFTFFIFCSPLLLRSRDAFWDFKGACVNIFDQNYNMGKFLHKYYDNTTVAINDLGCPSYFTQGKIIDLWGLGNMDVARSKRNKYYVASFLDTLVKKEGVKIAIVFDRLYNPALLSKWHKIGIWHINDIVVAGSPDLCFYAVDTTLDNDLLNKLKAYQPDLPPNVTPAYRH